MYARTYARRATRKWCLVGLRRLLHDEAFSIPASQAESDEYLPTLPTGLLVGE